MSVRTVKKIKSYDRVIDCMPDKSISIRAVLFNAIADGTAVIENLLQSDDVKSALGCAESLGAHVEFIGGKVIITGARPAGSRLDCGNSGTTARLLTGLLAGYDGTFRISGDDSLRSRPMRRVIDPIVSMGGKIVCDIADGRLPLSVIDAPESLRGIDYEMPIASAQVKSAILLAGLSADGETTVRERVISRDHTENMLAAMGADIMRGDGYTTVRRSALCAKDMIVTGDISSAAYPMCLALMTGGRCTVKNVGINKTRTGILDVLNDMGANIVYENLRGGAEPSADITVSGGNRLKPFEIDGDIIPRLIDEIPALCALACFVEGDSIVRGASELRVKETDRIASTADALGALGANVETASDGLIVHGGKKLSFGVVDPRLDHRIAMIGAIAGAAGDGANILDAECAAVSYPNFFGEVIDV